MHELQRPKSSTMPILGRKLVLIWSTTEKTIMQDTEHFSEWKGDRRDFEQWKERIWDAILHGQVNSKFCSW